MSSVYLPALIVTFVPAVPTAARGGVERVSQLAEHVARAPAATVERRLSERARRYAAFRDRLLACWPTEERAGAATQAARRVRASLAEHASTWVRRRVGPALEDLDELSVRVAGSLSEELPLAVRSACSEQLARFELSLAALCLHPADQGDAARLRLAEQAVRAGTITRGVLDTFSCIPAELFVTTQNTAGPDTRQGRERSTPIGWSHVELGTGR